MNKNRYLFFLAISLSVSLLQAQGNNKNSDKEQAVQEHSLIGVDENLKSAKLHTMDPGAQWFPDAGFGLFIHWGIASVKNLDISWPMIVGRALSEKKLSNEDIRRIVREKDYNLNGKPPVITPNEYWSMAKDFNPHHYDPDKWIKAAKAAGFKYAVLTTRHHEGFALWPSAYGNFSTSNYMGGKDLIRPFVEACRKYGLKVGLYYSPPNWYFDKDYMTFLYGKAYKNNPGLPRLNADLNPVTLHHTDAEIKAHQSAFLALVKGQVEELLTRYGKIDLLWFDGKAPVPGGNNAITQEEIRKLQPGIVINPRMHGHGDFITFERNPPSKDPGNVWAEFCNTWTNSWANSNTIPFRSDAFVLGQLVRCRSWGVNYLLGVGPTAEGIFPEAVYKNMDIVAGWMKKNAESINQVNSLPKNESASVPATAKLNTRYLFAIPEFKENGKYDSEMLPLNDLTIKYKINRAPRSVTLLALNKKLNYQFDKGLLTIELPVSLRTKLVDVVKVAL